MILLSYLKFTLLSYVDFISYSYPTSLSIIRLANNRVLLELGTFFKPFDTKPMAKIAVKMGIMRVVKFMSS